MSEPTELERRVRRAVRFEVQTQCVKADEMPLLIEADALKIARAAIAECFRWRPIEEAPQEVRDHSASLSDGQPPSSFKVLIGRHVCQPTTDDAGRTILLWWLNDEQRWVWLPLPGPGEIA